MKNVSKFTLKDLNMAEKNHKGLKIILAELSCSETDFFNRIKSLFGGNEKRAKDVIDDLKKIDDNNEGEIVKSAKTKRKNAEKAKAKAEAAEKAEKAKLDAMTPLERKQYYRDGFEKQLADLREQLEPINERLTEQSRYITELRKKKQAAERALREANENLTNAEDAHKALKSQAAGITGEIDTISGKILDIDKEIKSLSQPVFLVYTPSDDGKLIDAENFDMSTLTEEAIKTEQSVIEGLCRNDNTGRFDLRKREVRPVAILLAAVRATGRKDCIVNFDNGLDEMKAVFEELR